MARLRWTRRERCLANDLRPSLVKESHCQVSDLVSLVGELQLPRGDEAANDRRLHVFAAAEGIELVPTDPVQTWKLRINHPGGGNLVKDPVTQEMEVQDVLVVLGYEWED